jgi:hydrogenase maturation protease
MSTVIIGIGNPVLSDDSVGLRIARELRHRVIARDVEIVELCTGGMRLVEAMAGYDRAIVVDAMESGARPGTVHQLDSAGLPMTRGAHSTHHGGLAEAMEVGRIAGLRIPGEIRVWGIEAADVETFSESLTPSVEEAVDTVVEGVLRSLQEP